jgi:methylenetetrahydrofolate reductase (NADPH)
MRFLQEILADRVHFARGMELVTTRGTMEEATVAATRALASDVAAADGIDWVSITDNAGGNPQLSALALGKPLLYAGKEVLIHLSCKDLNRNGLESVAWQMASEGFRNILALTGDYPTSGYQGAAKPVFDIDSIGLLKLLSDMNAGLNPPVARNQGPALRRTAFFVGAVATNFKFAENELVPQLLKLRKKVEVGARFIIGQIGFDARKQSELVAYMRSDGLAGVPLVGSVFVMSARLAQFFRRGRIAGVVVSDAFCAMAERHRDDRRFFLELAAKQAAIFKGLGYRGVYYGGIERMADVQAVLDIEQSFAADDWKQFAREINYSRPGEFFYYAENGHSGLADASTLNPEYSRSLETRRPSPNVTLGYKLSRWVHDRVFTPGTAAFRFGRARFERARDPHQGPGFLRMVERVSKAGMFQCKDCGDCSLPDIAYLCPESACAKNQRNGPCGGTRDGKCEVGEFECIWAKAYDRLKAAGREQQLLAHAPVIQNQALRHTSSWGNTFRGLDHHRLVPAATPVRPDTTGAARSLDVPRHRPS